MSNIEDYEIPEPCDASWDDMTVVERGRFCQRCQHDVVDAEMLNEAQWLALLERSDEEFICVRVVSINNQPQLNVPEQLQRQRRGLQTMIQVAAAVSLVGLAACDVHEEPTQATAQPAMTKPSPAKPAASKTPPSATQPTIKTMPKPTRTGNRYGRQDFDGKPRVLTLKDALKDLETIYMGRLKRPRKTKSHKTHLIIARDPKK